MLSWPKLTCKLNKSLMMWLRNLQAETNFLYCTKLLKLESMSFITRLLKINIFNFKKEHFDKWHWRKERVEEVASRKAVGNLIPHSVDIYYSRQENGPTEMPHANIWRLWINWVPWQEWLHVWLTFLWRGGRLSMVIGVGLFSHGSLKVKIIPCLWSEREMWLWQECQHHSNAGFE